MLVVPRILNQQLLSFLVCLIPLCALGQVPSASTTPYEASTTLSGAGSASREFQLIDADGNKFPVEKRMALCRCGASTEKPFCDGTHSKIGFQAAEKAVPESKE